VIFAKTYQRRTFRVLAIQVRVDNIEALAKWCGGVLMDDDLPATNTAYIQVPISNIMGREQTTRAHIGDWLTRLVDADNYRVYKNKSFGQAFKEVADDAQRYAEVHSIVVNVMRKQDSATYNGESSRGMDEAADKATRDILGLF